MPEKQFNIKGLNLAQVQDARKKHGSNRLAYHKVNGFAEALKSIAKEPMVILLVVAASFYFMSGEVGNGIFLLFAVVFEVAISLYQNSRSHNALEKLKDLTQPKSKVIREGEVVQINSEEVVVGDSLMVEEGGSVTADGTIVHSNDFSVNESVLTGESMAVAKDKESEDNLIFSGTTVASGLAIATITAIGSQTKLGKIGKSLESIGEEKTPLELQINNFVKKMVMAGAGVFLIVWGVNFFHSHLLLDSLLKALTLALSIIPEEIPVAFTSFMALGAWRLMKAGIVVKQMKTVETLGSATVICTDKTGTITENKMSLARLFVLASNQVTNPGSKPTVEETDLIRLAMWASEPIPFDPMEVALHEAYASSGLVDERSDFKMLHEYPLDGKPPMMTHIFENKSGHRIIAAKGAPEALMQVSSLSEANKTEIGRAIDVLAVEGYRLLGVGEAKFEGQNFPATQQEFKFDFKGIVAFYDPPKKNIASVLEAFYKAGIEVKIVTGDNAATTTAIAKQVGFRGYEKSMTGDELMALSEPELKKKVMEIQLFTRMFPEAKLKIINALKARHQIVAMTGDGVNDGPALKAAHIGIAMGKKGTEIAKQAASLILVHDDFSKMVDAVAMGRRIYTNLKKGIQYIISIHIPIILIVFIPLTLGWKFPNIFSVVHVIFLELIMGPTCSIIYENEPIERNAMEQKPRPISNTFFSGRELATSVFQGILITVGSLAVYLFSVHEGYDESLTRTMVFTTLISANVFLTLVNRSFYYSIITTLRYKNNLVPLIIGVTTLLTGFILYVPSLARFFQFEAVSLSQLSLCIGIGLGSVIWFEGVKGWRRS